MVGQNHIENTAKKLEAARLRRLESKKKSTYVESVVSKMEEFSTDEKI